MKQPLTQSDENRFTSLEIKT